MDRTEFCDRYWSYYLVLEKDFLETERYIAFDLGDNSSYNEVATTNMGNSLTFSNEYIKQYQAICSEVDVVMKVMCKEFDKPSADNMKDDYTPIILNHWNTITSQRVKMRNIELQPFINWSREGDGNSYHAPDWWPLYNKVKHQRHISYKEANLKNVINALAGLFILENYLIKYIGDRLNDKDVPNDRSYLFEMVDFETREDVEGPDNYAVKESDIDGIFDNLD